MVSLPGGWTGVMSILVGWLVVIESNYERLAFTESTGEGRGREREGRPEKQGRGLEDVRRRIAAAIVFSGSDSKCGLSIVLRVDSSRVISANKFSSSYQKIRSIWDWKKKIIKFTKSKNLILSEWDDLTKTLGRCQAQLYQMNKIHKITKTWSDSTPSMKPGGERWGKKDLRHGRAGFLSCMWRGGWWGYQYLGKSNQIFCIHLKIFVFLFNLIYIFSNIFII